MFCKQNIRSVILFIGSVVLSGCITGLLEYTEVSNSQIATLPSQLPPVKEITIKNSFSVTTSLSGGSSSEYRIGVEDELEISVYSDLKLNASPSPEYRIAVDDDLEISVYGHKDLAKTQAVRPDGKIEFPLAGDIQASGLTPDELREQIRQHLSKFVKNPQVTVIVSDYKSKKLSILGKAKTQTVRPDGTIGFPLVGDIQASNLTPRELREEIERGLSAYVKNPRVTVVVTKYNSKKVSILGEVEKPGLLRLSSDISLLEGISRAEGVTKAADLQGAFLVRHGKILPVSFEKLLRQGDLRQNVLLKPNDVIFIPNVSAKKVFVLGEVNKPLVIALKHRVTLIEAISQAGGFTRDAVSSNVLIVRGGLANPKIIKVNVDEITKRGKVAYNVPLKAGDIVYAPKSLIANVASFFDYLSRIVSPLVIYETGITQLPDVKAVFNSGKTISQQGRGAVSIPVGGGQ